MQVFYLAKLAEFVRHILLSCFFVYVRYENNPPFYGTSSPSIGILDVRRFHAIIRRFSRDCGVITTGILKAPASATDTPGYDFIKKRHLTTEEAQKSLDRLVALKQVVLRVGAQVMLIQNLKQGRLVNGSVGRVVNFITPEEAFEGDIEIAKVDQSKSLKAVMERAANPKPFDPMGVVAASSSSQTFSNIVDPDCSCEPGYCWCDPRPSQEEPGEMRWPVVLFTNGERLVLPPMEFSVVNYFGIVESKRVQIPLILAWALSIHKSQGQTLERVKVDLGSIFEKGQAYVALSRATNLETLQVLNFNPHKVMAHPRVIEWSKTLQIHSVVGGDESDQDEDF